MGSGEGYPLPRSGGSRAEWSHAELKRSAATYVEGGRLRVRDVHGEDVLFPSGTDAFELADQPTSLVFHRDAAGRIVAAGWIGEIWAEERGERIGAPSAVRSP